MGGVEGMDGGGGGGTKMGDRGDDYSFVAFPGDNGHAGNKINCRQHAMVCLLNHCTTHTRKQAASLLCGFRSVAGGAVCRWFVFVESLLKNAASGSGSGMHAFPYDIPLPW